MQSLNENGRVKYQSISEGANVVIPILIPLISLYFFSMPSKLDFFLVPVLFICFSLNVRNIVLNLTGYRLCFLFVFSVSAIVGLMNGWDAASIVRDLVSLLPLLFVCFREKTNYLLIVKVLFWVSLFTTLYQIYLVASYGGRAHYYYLNSMIPFCNLLFFYAVYVFTNRKSKILGAFILGVSLLGVASTGSKVNLLILVVSVVSLLFLSGARGLAIFMCAAMAVALLLVFKYFSEELILVERVMSLMHGGDSSTGSRLLEFSLGMKVFEGNEFLGTGLGSSIQMYGREILYFHLSPLYFFFKFGVFSIVFYLAYLFLLGKAVYLATNSSHAFWFRASALGGGVTLLVYILVFPSYKYIHMNILLGLYLSLLSYSERQG